MAPARSRRSKPVVLAENVGQRVPGIHVQEQRQIAGGRRDVDQGHGPCVLQRVPVRRGWSLASDTARFRAIVLTPTPLTGEKTVMIWPRLLAAGWAVSIVARAAARSWRRLLTSRYSRAPARMASRIKATSGSPTASTGPATRRWAARIAASPSPPAPSQ